MEKKYIFLIILILVTLLLIAGKKSDIEKSTQKPFPTATFIQSYDNGNHLHSALTYTPLAGWHVENYTEDQVTLITSPDFVKEDHDMENRYEMIPKQGVLITMKVNNNIDKHFNLQELSEWMQTEGTWQETNQVSLGGIPTIHTFGKYKYPGIEGIGLPVLDDWYQSDEIGREYFFEIRISYAGTDAQAKALRNKYKPQIDQFLQSIRFHAYNAGNE